MGIGIGTAIAVSAGAGVVKARKQQDAQEDAIAEQQKLEAQAREQEQAIFQQQALEDAQNAEKATAIYGQDDDDEMGSFSDFITPTTQSTKTGLATGGSTGLGF